MPAVHCRQGCASRWVGRELWIPCSQVLQAMAHSELFSMILLFSTSRYIGMIMVSFIPVALLGVWNLVGRDQDLDSKSGNH